ncbi:hypothetical protein V5F34_08530 [Xanthobacter autotrophicus]|uniref:hypothetical protein n=1 Tax=Xanthobacter autotrophicus TaxID=280 RepID=UPI00372AFBDD
MTTTKIHTYSDGSQIELGSPPGKGWLAVVKEGPEAVRKVTGRGALRMKPEETTRPDREF